MAKSKTYYNSSLGFNGKTPGILPSALKSSATHVFDPDFSIGQASDPLLNLKGQALATAQRNRRSNNTITYDSVFDIDGKTPNKSIDTPRSENIKSTIGLDGKKPPTYKDNPPEAQAKF